MSAVLVDTCIWSLALRGSSPKETSLAEQLSQLIDNNQVRIIGSIRQELLSGYSDKNSFERLRQRISYFPNAPFWMPTTKRRRNTQTCAAQKAYKARILIF